MFFLLLALIMAIVAVIFAVINTDTVTVSILVQQFPDVPVAMVVVISLLLGMLIAIFGILPSLIRNKMNISGQRKKITALEKSVVEQQSKVEQLQLKLNPPLNVPVTPTTSGLPSKEPSDSTTDPVI